VIRVCIVEDQTLVRQGLVRLLSLASDIEVVGEAGDGDEARNVIRRTAPDVVLLDVRMPRASGLARPSRIPSKAAIPSAVHSADHL
jgi:YesN/AraC family two-component response regulator